MPALNPHPGTPNPTPTCRGWATPLPRRLQLPFWLNSTAFAAAWLLLMMYGTLMPFKIAKHARLADPSLALSWTLDWLTKPLAPHHGPAYASSLGTPAWLSDAVINIALWMPLGMLLMHAADRRLPRRFVRNFLATVTLAATLSWLFECTQGLMPGRVASLLDVSLNTLGCAIGALVAPPLWRSTHRSLMAAYLRHPIARRRVAQRFDRYAAASPLFFALVGLQAGLIIAFFILTADAPPDARFTINWHPFELYFERSYDVAMLHVARAMTLYLGVAFILSLPFLRDRDTAGLIAPVFVTTLLACVVTISRAISHGDSADITEPVLALAAAWSTFTLIALVRYILERTSFVYDKTLARQKPHTL